jgi:hypothetical protein
VSPPHGRRCDAIVGAGQTDFGVSVLAWPPGRLRSFRRARHIGDDGDRSDVVLDLKTTRRAQRPGSGRVVPRREGNNALVLRAGDGRIRWSAVVVGVFVTAVVLTAGSCGSVMIGHAADKSVFTKCSETELGRNSSGIEIDYQWTKFAFRCTYGGGPPDYRTGANGTSTVSLRTAFSGG